MPRCQAFSPAGCAQEPHRHWVLVGVCQEWRVVCAHCSLLLHFCVLLCCSLMGWDYIWYFILMNLVFEHVGVHNILRQSMLTIEWSPEWVFYKREAHCAEVQGLFYTALRILHRSFLQKAPTNGSSWKKNQSILCNGAESTLFHYKTKF